MTIIIHGIFVVFETRSKPHLEVRYPYDNPSPDQTPPPGTGTPGPGTPSR